MAIKVDEEWRYRKAKSEAASKSAFTFKINRELMQQNQHRQQKQGKILYGHKNIIPYSKQVIVKITGGARSKRGIKNTVEYISEDWKNEITDKNGIVYNTKEEMQDAVSILQENAVGSASVQPKKELKLTHNIVFSSPKGAGVTKEDILRATLETLKTKYPDNYFVAAYHNEANNPHVHIVLNINKDCGGRIDIRKKDLKDLRESFANTLMNYGYDVEANDKYKNEKYNLTKKDLDELNTDNRNIYELVEFGTESYKANNDNNKNNYLIYKTANNTEVTIWGKELLEDVMSKNIKKGDLIRINKTGSIDVKVPVFGDNKEIISWKSAKRNQWSVEKADSNNNDHSYSKKTERSKDLEHQRESEYSKEIKLDSLQQAAKQLKQREKFNYMKKFILNKSLKEKYILKPELHYQQQKQSIKF